MDQNRSSPGPTQSKSERRGEGAKKRAGSGAGEGEQVTSRRRTRARAGAGEETDGPRAGVLDAAGELDADADGLRALESSAQEGLMAMGQALEEQLRERPYVTLGVAFGVGLVVSQALSSRIGRVALMLAGGYAVTKLLQSDGLGLVERVLGGDEGDELDDVGGDEDFDDDDALLGDA